MMTDLRVVYCDCSMTDLCPNRLGLMGFQAKCCMLMDAKHLTGDHAKWWDPIGMIRDMRGDPIIEDDDQPGWVA